jgi:hypothetical protein
MRFSMPIEIILIIIGAGLLVICCVLYDAYRSSDENYNKTDNGDYKPPFGPIAIFEFILKIIAMIYVDFISFRTYVNATTSAGAMMNHIEIYFRPAIKYFSYLLGSKVWIEHFAIFRIFQKRRDILTEPFVCLCHWFTHNEKLSRSVSDRLD